MSELSNISLDRFNINKIGTYNQVKIVNCYQYQFQKQPYTFWVTASTIKGEGPVSEFVAESPRGSASPAAVAAFTQKVTLAVKEEANLPCPAIGEPTPTTIWRYK